MFRPDKGVPPSDDEQWEDLALVKIGTYGQ